MRIASIQANDVPPIQTFEVANLADTVVLAGRNGVGKTRLVQSVIQTLRHPNDAGSIQMTIEATCQAERLAWQKNVLDTNDPSDAQLLTQTLQRGNRKRVKWQSSIVQFESDRTIQLIKPYTFSWDVVDPWEEDVGWDQTFGFLRDRFQDTLHSLFRKVQTRRNKIARTAEDLIKRGERTMTLDFEDPLEPFKEVFTQLLAPKQLIDPDPRNQNLQYSLNGQVHPIESLSSGEREVVNVVFDFLLRSPTDCVVFFDEPELHLHPELSYKLLQTLQNVAGRNQFIYCTHSPDIISASLDQSVIFIGPAGEENKNQAIPVRSDDDTNEALKLLGQSVGIIALGKKLVLVEGDHASLDKQLYGSIIGEKYPELVLVPSKGRDVIASFSVVNENVLSRSLWGVEFFMLCDRDAVPPNTDVERLEAESNGRLRVLRRYHLENYLLDPVVLSSVFVDLEPDDSWLHDPKQVEAKLIDIARTRLSYTTALYVSSELRQLAGNVNVMPRDCHEKTEEQLNALILEQATSELARVGHVLNSDDVSDSISRTWRTLEASLGQASWIALFPGKQIFNIFAAETTLGVPRLKRAYLRSALAEYPETFQDLDATFRAFANHTV